MKIKFLSAVLIPIIAVASSQEGVKDISLYADRFESKDNKVYAYGHILISYEGNLFMGERAIFDRDRDKIVVFGNAEIIGAKGNKITADKIDFEVDKHKIVFKNFFHTAKEDIWIASRDAIKQNDEYKFNNSFISSCSTKNPDWSMHFERADYNATSKYIKLDNVKFYAKDTPILYLPYLAFSLNRERSSGLLMPKIRFNEDEGFIYNQPYFWAISKSMDMEFNPQIRTKRGVGLYTTFRFVDGPNSYGEIRSGYFKDKSRYTDEHNLKYSSHYGLEALYESRDFLKSYKPNGYRDGLYINLNLFNDIDYLTLQYDKMFHFENTSRYKESRFNYFLYNEDNYFHIGSRYFIDTTLTDNGSTLQELPSLQYHKFSKSFLNNYLDYSIDLNIKNYYREDGLKAYRADLSIPLSFHTSLFGGYVDFSIKEELDGRWTNFSKEIANHSRYYALTLNHSIELSSQLLKAYQSGIHTMIFSIAYSNSSFLNESDFKYSNLLEFIRQDFSLEPMRQEKVSISMHHFWESNGGDLKIDYLLRGDYYPSVDSQWSLLRQEIHIDYHKWNYSSLYTYSFKTNETIEFANRISYSSDMYRFSLDYTWKKDYWVSDLWQKELKFDLNYKYNQKVSIYSAFTYDIEKHYNKDWEVGLMYDRKCWNMQVLFRQEITPVLRDSGVGSVRDNSIMFRFNLVPFGGSGLDKKLL